MALKNKKKRKRKRGTEINGKHIGGNGKQINPENQKEKGE
jgi:hypothetical protein